MNLPEAQGQSLTLTEHLNHLPLRSSCWQGALYRPDGAKGWAGSHPAEVRSPSRSRLPAWGSTQPSESCAYTPRRTERGRRPPTREMVSVPDFHQTHLADVRREQCSQAGSRRRNQGRRARTEARRAREQLPTLRPPPAKHSSRDLPSCSRQQQPLFSRRHRPADPACSPGALGVAL